jgi:hypothetical protein
MIDVLKRKVLNEEIRAGVYVCPFTEKQVSADDAIFLGPIVPSVSGSYVCHIDAEEERVKSKKAFDEFEKNCNTCADLKRLPHDKKGGFMRGSCHKLGDHKFHPDDPMFMDCWQARGMVGSSKSLEQYT